MPAKRIIYFLCLFIISVQGSFAQLNDSTAIYKRIKQIADKNSFAAFIYNAIFVDPSPQEYPLNPVSKETKIVNPYLKYEDKIIHHIDIKVYDPFGYSVNDTVSKTKNLVQRTGNKLHVTSYKKVISSRLLFKENEPLNSLAISESERLLRQSGFINDAKVIVTQINSSDSVDVCVLVHDKWTVDVPISISDVSAYARFKNQSLLGTGNQFEQYVGFTRPDRMDYSGFYNISNIHNTYLSSRLFYENNPQGTVIGISAQSPFYSPLAKMAGSMNVTRSWKYFSYVDSLDNQPKLSDLNSMSYDLWLGKSIKINSKRKLFNQSTNLIVGERFYITQYDKRPSFSIDKEKINVNANTILGNLGLAVQQFYKEKFVYRFGANEDVPQGLIMQVVYGVTDTEFSKARYYIGGEIARAHHYKAGYFSIVASSGMFLTSDKKEDITGRLKLNYFSDLFKIGKWYFREFVNSYCVSGMNKLPSEKLTLTADDLYGFNSGSLNGNSKMVMNIETVAYAPYNLVGFRFAPTLLLGYGMIGDEKKSILSSNLYQAYALALMVRNENLLTSTFQVSVGMYPFLPNGQNNVFKYSPVTSFTLKLNVFAIGRPEFISY